MSRPRPQLLSTALLALALGCGVGEQQGLPGDGCEHACAEVGETRCEGDDLRHCERDPEGCREWGPAESCPGEEERCDPEVNACIGICEVAAVQTECEIGSAAIRACCEGGDIFPPGEPSAGILCQAALNMDDPHDRDPERLCDRMARTECWELHASSTPGDCCCPEGHYCDPERDNACVTSCATASDCAQSPDGPACAPVVLEDRVAVAYRVCKADDGAPWRGCEEAGCAAGYECWREGAGNAICVRSCDSDDACGPDGCCDLAATCEEDGSACSGEGGCFPCE
jgi:hypothetical protein